MKLLDNNFFIFILAFVIAIVFVNQSVVIDFKGIIYFSTYMVILILAGFVTIKFLFKIYDIASLKLSKN